MPASLASPLTINGKTLRNRIIMPPLVCFNWADDDGLETYSRAEHYGRRARGGAALIVVEATAICRDGRITNSGLGLWSNRQIDQFARIADACHEAGALVTVQLVHAGAKATANPALSASADSSGDRPVQAMRQDQLEAVVDDFVAASLRAEAAGLDGVEIHGAHGYLLNQFCAAATNRREDDYGGEACGRQRLAREVSRAVRTATGREFIVGYRLGVNDPSLAEDLELAAGLAEDGVDWLNVSAGLGGESIAVPEGFPEHYVTWMGCAMHRRQSLPVACVFGIRQPVQAAALLHDDYTDLVAVGRGMLADADWANKALTGQPVDACLHCAGGCQYRKDGRLCPVDRAWRQSST